MRALRAHLTQVSGLAIIQAMLPIAHAGHWAIWILYAVPVVVVLGSIVAQLRRERREERAAEEGPEPGPTEPTP